MQREGDRVLVIAGDALLDLFWRVVVSQFALPYQGGYRLDAEMAGEESSSYKAKLENVICIPISQKQTKLFFQEQNPHGAIDISCYTMYINLVVTDKILFDLYIFPTMSVFVTRYMQAVPL
jgi:hypothetical protein